MYVAPNGLRYDTHQDYLYDLKEDMSMNMNIDIVNIKVAENTTLKVKEDDTMTNMTVKELRDRAKELKISGYSKMNKKDLIASIKFFTDDDRKAREAVVTPVIEEKDNVPVEDKPSYRTGIITNGASRALDIANTFKEDDSMFKKIETFKFKDVATLAKKALDFYHNGEDCTVFRRVDSAFSYTGTGDNYAIAFHDDGGFGEFKISLGYGLYKETKKGWRFITEVDSKEKLSVVLRGEELWKSLDKKKFVSIVEDQFVKQSLVRYKKLFYKTECGTYDISRPRLCGVIGDGFKKCGIKERNNHLMTLALDSFVQSCVLSQRLESDRKEGQSTYFTTKDVLNNLHKMYK